MCSGGDRTLRAGESAQNQFNSTLTNAFNAQFGNQQNVLNFLTNKLQATVNNPQGFSPEALAAARSSAIENTAGNYANAARTVNNQIAARGGSALPSGVNAQIQGELAAGAANQESQNLNQINLANEQQRQNNYWNAVQGLSGTANMYNPNGIAGEVNAGTNALTNIGQAFNATTQQGFGATFLHGFGSALGKGLGTALSGGGGVGGLFGGGGSGGGGSNG
jgi:hypothetical protein